MRDDIEEADTQQGMYETEQREQHYEDVANEQYD